MVMLEDEVDFSLPTTGSLPVEKPRIFPRFEKTAQMLRCKLLGQSALVRPDGVIKVPQIEAGKSQLHPENIRGKNVKNNALFM